MIQLKNKTCLIPNIKKYMKETGKITALSISLIAPVTLFAQGSGCDTNDPDCIYVIGTPLPGPPIGPPDPINPPGCDFLGDPDCDEGGDDGGSSGGGSSNPDIQACLTLYQDLEDSCIFDPIGPTEYNWNPFGTSFKNRFWFVLGGGIISGNFIDFGAPIQIYQNIIGNVARAYWTNQSQAAVNVAYWNAVDSYCETFPLESTFGGDRADCYSSAYKASRQLVPAYSDSAFTISQIEIWGITVVNSSSGANWGADFFVNINEIKECKLWFDRKDEIPGCE